MKNIDGLKVKIGIIFVLFSIIVISIITINKEPVIKNELVINEKENEITPDIENKEVKLEEQIKTKNYVEQSFISLEYSKISLENLKEEIMRYLSLKDDKKEEYEDGFVKILELNKETFFNRYMKVFLQFPSVENDVKDLDISVKEILYNIKEGYVEIDKYLDSRDDSYLNNAVSYYDEVFIKFDKVLEEVGKKDIEIEKEWMNLPNEKK